MPPIVNDRVSVVCRSVCRCV